MQILDTINRIQTILPHVLVLALPFIEVGVRLVPSANKLSFFYTLADTFHGIGNLSHAIGDSLNSVIPQKIAAPDQPKAEMVAEVVGA